MDLVTLTHELYAPIYDPETDTYRDENPFQKNSRNNPIYECRCKVGTLLTTYSQFLVHRQTRTHCKFIKSYKTYYKDADKAKDEIKGLLVENERLKRTVQKCEGIIRIRDLEISFLNGLGKADKDKDKEEVIAEGEEDVFEDARQGILDP
jgi:hypothetical protein